MMPTKADKFMRKTLFFIFFFVSTAALSQGQTQEEKANPPLYAHSGQGTQEQPLKNKSKKIGEGNNLEKILNKDAKREGLVLGFVSALALLYDAISDTLLYPIFSFLFFAMTAGLILLVALLAIKIRKDQSWAVRTLSFFLPLYLLIYIDLFLVMYEKNKVLFLFLEFEKDIALVVLAAGIGFFAGKSLSKSVFEEKDVP
jgi:hypothetical protein